VEGALELAQVVEKWRISAALLHVHLPATRPNGSSRLDLILATIGRSCSFVERVSQGVP
jgi:hypothetical protein